MGGDFQQERQAQEHARAGQLHGGCPFEVCCNRAHKIQVIRDLKLGPVFKKTGIGGNPKALNKEGLYIKGEQEDQKSGEKISWGKRRELGGTSELEGKYRERGGVGQD